MVGDASKKTSLHAEDALDEALSRIVIFVLMMCHIPLEMAAGGGGGIDLLLHAVSTAGKVMVALLGGLS